MGGAAAQGNATASAGSTSSTTRGGAVVLDAAADLGVPVFMYGLDVFGAPTLSPAEAAEIVAAGRACGDRAAELAGLLIDFQSHRFRDRRDDRRRGRGRQPRRPELLTWAEHPVRVELAGTWSRGRTIVDQRTASPDRDHDPHGLSPTVVRVAPGIDGPAVARLWRHTVTGEPTTTPGTDDGRPS